MPLNPYSLSALTGLSQALPGTGFQPSQVQGRFANPMDDDQQTVFPSDPNAALAALQDQRKTELMRNMASGGAGPEAGVNLADLQSDIQKNPLTQQSADVAATNAANQAAMMQGFRGGPVRQVTGDSPQASGASFESGIVDSPAQQMAKAQRTAELQKALGPTEAKAAGDLAVERMKEDAATRRSSDFLSLLKGGLNLQPGQEIDLPGAGGKMRQNYVPPQPIPAGQVGANIESAIKNRMDMEDPSFYNTTSLTNKYLGVGPNLQQQKIRTENRLDADYPQWRDRVKMANPSFQFATGPQATPSVPGGQPNLAKPAGVPTAGRLTGKSKSTGSPVYSDDGGKTWFSGQ